VTGCPRQPHLHVFADRAMWRWSYHEPPGGPTADGGRDDATADDGLRLESSIAFADADEARSSATAAYPGVPLASDGQQPPGAASQPAPTTHRCRRGVLAALVTVVLATTVVIVVRRRVTEEWNLTGKPKARRS